MPFTPYHLGPALLFGVLLFRWFDFPTFLAANVVVDIRAALVYLGYLDGTLHGPLHTFAIGSVLALVLSAVVYVIKPMFNRVFAPLELAQERRWRAVVAAAMVGVSLHICLDSMLYTDIRPLFPLEYNPLFGVLGSVAVYGLCLLAFVLGTVAAAGRLLVLRLRVTD